MIMMEDERERCTHDSECLILKFSLRTQENNKSLQKESFLVMHLVSDGCALHSRGVKSFTSWCLCWRRRERERERERKGKTVHEKRAAFKRDFDEKRGHKTL
jgi:hypothetical protein